MASLLELPTWADQCQVRLVGDNGNDAHPNKKRKFTEPPKGKALMTLRPISSPWKKIAVECARAAPSADAFLSQ